MTKSKGTPFSMVFVVTPQGVHLVHFTVRYVVLLVDRSLLNSQCLFSNASVS